ncbi:P-II family nitrogen regulator [Breznakiellaceae bacterium SP9]
MAKTNTTTANSQLRLKALFIITDWDKLHIISEVFAKEECLLSYVSHGQGTASSDALSLLGLGATSKAVFFCLVQSTETPRIITGVRQAMGAGSVGAGIAFSVPLSGITESIFSMFAKVAAQAEAERLILDTARPKESKSIGQKVLDKIKGDGKVANKEIEIKNGMIISILNSGNSDAYMKEAKKAGARGGTVIDARGISQEGIKKFFGITVQQEKEIIIIMADKDKILPIMDAVKTDFGTTSKAAGVIFSLPVDQVMSLNALA